MSEDIKQEVENHIETEAAAIQALADKPPEITRSFLKKCLNANERGDAVLFATLKPHQHRYGQDSGDWYYWKDHYYEQDKGNLKVHDGVEDLAVEYEKEATNLEKEADEIRSDEDSKSRLKRLEKEADANRKRAYSLRGQSRIKNVISLAKNFLAIPDNVFDSNPFSLAHKAGVVNLRTGRNRSGRSEDHCLKHCSVPLDDIEAEPEKWIQTLMDIFNEDEEMVNFMQRVLGSTLLGFPNRKLFSFEGPGGNNGKTTICEKVAEILGDYATAIRSEMLMDSYTVNPNSPSPETMALMGARFVWTSETRDGAKYDIAKVKLLTGNDTMVGRRPHDKYETRFKPSHSLILLTNNKPHANADDAAFWRRVVSIPFEVSFVDKPEKDNEKPINPKINEELAEENSAILAWLVRGCFEYQEIGLDPPQKVIDATMEYHAEEDYIGAFIDEVLEERPGVNISASELHAYFEIWYRENIGKYPPKQKKFGSRVKKRLDSQRGSRCVEYLNIYPTEDWQRKMEGKGVV